MELTYNLNITKAELSTLRKFFYIVDELDLEDGQICELLDNINEEEEEVKLSFRDSNMTMQVFVNYQD